MKKILCILMVLLNFTLIFNVFANKDENKNNSPQNTIHKGHKGYNLKNEGAYIFGKTDSLMCPNEKIERQEACAMLYRLLKQNNLTGDFKEVDANEKTWSINAVRYMCYKGIYEKEPSLHETITRKEAFKLFCISLGYDNSILKGYEHYTNVLKDIGYIQGYEDGLLHTERKITRAEFCKVYNIIIGRNRNKLIDKNGKRITEKTYGFKDLNHTDWYYDIMLKATSAYDKNGFVDISRRVKRNEIDNY